jgi:alkylation response protein AidB-like acyl-CoA dehydrogenase
MATFNPDLRDIKFCLYEQIEADKHLLALDKFSDWDKDTFDQLLATAQKFASDVIAPLNEQADRVGAKHHEDGSVTMPPGFKEAWAKLREGGWIAPTMPADHGGLGLPETISQAANEMFIAASCAFSLTGLLTRGSGHLIEAYGTDALKALFLDKMFSGEWAGTMCLTEPQAGSDVGATRTTAIPVEGTDIYAIDGTKIYITSGNHDLTPNIVHLVLARRPGAPAGTAGISLFAVPKFRPENGQLVPNDVFCVGIEKKMGIHGSPTCILRFGENGKCFGWLVGEGEKGMRYMFQMMNEARLEVGVQGQALAAQSYFHAVNFAYSRKQGKNLADFTNENAPQTEIINHPDVRRNLMFMKSSVEGMRAFLIELALMIDLSKSHPDAEKRKHYDNIIALLTPIAKAYCTDLGFDVTVTGVQVFGGSGFLKDYPMEQLVRDAKIASIYEGTNGIQALDLLVRKVGKAGGLLYMTWMGELNEFLGAHEGHARLGGMVAAVAKARDALNDVTMKFLELGVDPYPVYSATPYLKLFGHVVVAQYSLKQAIIADAKLQALGAQFNATDDKALRKLGKEHPDAAFYFDKVQSAKFFITQTLPGVYGLKESIFSLDKSALLAHLTAYADA